MKLPKGVTYRQLGYWVDQGYLEDKSLMPGSPGHQVSWTPEQYQLITLVGLLRLAGLEAKVAGYLATIAPVSDGTFFEYHLATGVVLSVNLEEVRALAKTYEENDVGQETTATAV